MDKPLSASLKSREKGEGGTEGGDISGSALTLKSLSKGWKNLCE